MIAVGIALVIVMATLGACNSKSVAVPTFEIRISLTPAAKEKLAKAGESIKGTIFFDGDGTPLPNVETAPFRDVFLGEHTFELELSGPIRITDAVISRDAYSRLSDNNYYFTVNVYSGRRSFKSNVLNGGYAQGRLTDLRSGKPIEITCDLLPSR
jgi:hypothetical protein